MAMVLASRTSKEVMVMATKGWGEDGDGTRRAAIMVDGGDSEAVAMMGRRQ